jgi:hypothetical protein
VALRAPELLTVRAAIAFLFAVTLATHLGTAAPRIDNVLVKMVPPGATSLVGVHMRELLATETFRKMIPSRALSGFDDFAAETGFDPRRDVNELLFATTGNGELVLARGRFKIDPGAMKDDKRIRHGEYTIWARETSGFCILDGTLAAAGDVTAIEAALDEWRHGKHRGAQALLAQTAPIDPAAQAWGVASGQGTFLVDRLPQGGSGLDFTQIFRKLQETWFEADLRNGLRLEAHGMAADEKDAMNLRDAVRGMVGLGRLNVPEDEPDLLRVFDGITAEQQGRAIMVKADIAPDVVGKLMDLLGQPSKRLGRGGVL